jgi:hypothetical protein
LGLFPQLEADDVRSTGMGQGGEDIQLSPAARKLIPYQIEAKSKATSQAHTYMDQAMSHGPHEPVVIVKKDRSYSIAMIRFEHFLELLQKLNKENDENRNPGV